MQPFRFRAQAALDLRQQDADRARHALAAANRRLRDAETRLAYARDRYEESVQRASTIDQGTEPAVAAWSRNWIAGQRLEVTRCEGAQEEAMKIAHNAQEDVVVTQRQVRSLELFKERRLAAHRRAEQAEEQRAMDELARLQFVVRRKRISLGDL
jgi:flagellar export protein FliJ